MIQPTYPGVYVEEISSGVHPIVGVSTSVAAFVDFFSRGPVNEAVQITSFGDFERTFGGLDTRSEASYAIQQFYLNGGQSAWVIRVNTKNEGMATARTVLKNNGDVLQVSAISPGEWGNRLQVAVDYNTKDKTKMFNLAVREVVADRGKTKVIKSEVFRNLTMRKGDSRYAVDVVNAQSLLVRLEDQNDETNAGRLPASTASVDIKDVIGAINNSAVDAKVFPHLENGDDGKLFDQDGTLAPGKYKDFGDAIVGTETDKTGIYALENIEPFHFNILCVPAAANLDDTNYSNVYSKAIPYCERKRAFALVDIPKDVDSFEKMTKQTYLSQLDGLRSANAAVYFPRLHIPDELNENRPRNVGPSGTIAGLYARTDAARGVWKAPAGTETSLERARLPVIVNDLNNGSLNMLGINVQRNFPVFGNVSWGARTLDGADVQGSEWKYIPVRRTALFIEESLYQGLKWVVFEPNAEPLWAQIRLNVGAFMYNLFRQGAFQGQSRNEAYFVRCDSQTTTQNDINNGIVNVAVGFAPLKPAEFVVIQLQQMAGQIQV